MQEIEAIKRKKWNLLTIKSDLNKTLFMQLFPFHAKSYYCLQCASDLILSERVVLTNFTVRVTWFLNYVYERLSKMHCYFKFSCISGAFPRTEYIKLLTS